MIRRANRWQDLPQPQGPASTSSDRVQPWRDQQYQDGRPSGLLDFYRTHAFCIACQASGAEPIPAEWDGDVPPFEQCRVCFGAGKVMVS